MKTTSWKRRSSRGSFENRPVSRGLLFALVEAASDDGAWLHIVEERAKHAVAELISEGDRVQMSDRRFRRELASWVHPNRARSREGIPGFGFGDLMSFAGPFVIRTFDTGGAAAGTRVKA